MFQRWGQQHLNAALRANSTQRLFAFLDSPDYPLHLTDFVTRVLPSVNKRFIWGKAVVHSSHWLQGSRALLLPRLPAPVPPLEDLCQHSSVQPCRGTDLDQAARDRALRPGFGLGARLRLGTGELLSSQCKAQKGQSGHARRPACDQGAEGPLP